VVRGLVLGGLYPLSYFLTDKTPASETLLRAASAAYPCEDHSPHPIDLPHASRLYKALLQGGHFNRATSQVEKAAGWDAGAFAQQFMDTVGKEVCVAICTKGDRNGAFVIAELCEALNGDGGKAARKTLKDWFGSAVVKEIENGEAKGKKILLEKITAL
jgi:pumilio family protein 6